MLGGWTSAAALDSRIQNEEEEEETMDVEEASIRRMAAMPLPSEGKDGKAHQSTMDTSGGTGSRPPPPGHPSSSLLAPSSYAFSCGDGGKGEGNEREERGGGGKTEAHEEEGKQDGSGGGGGSG